MMAGGKEHLDQIWTRARRGDDRHVGMVYDSALAPLRTQNEQNNVERKYIKRSRQSLGEARDTDATWLKQAS